jgi:hypothetical protein
MNKLTVSAAKHKFGSLYHVAKLLNLNRSSIGRWGRYVPDKYAQALHALPAQKLERGGKRNA